MDVPPTAFIIGCVAACRALASGLVRNVGISCLALGTVVTRARTLLWISSGLKSLAGSIHVPASMPATFNPARARGRTATPPAAPNPTTATSTGFRLMAMILPVAVSGMVVRLDLHAHLLIGGRSGHARAWVSDQIPSCEILVAAIVGVAEHSFHGQPARSIEKRPRVRDPFGISALHGCENCVLFIGW